MAKQQPESRVFTKKVDGKTVKRHVTSPQAEVAALFDGFTEQAKPTSTSSTSTSGSGRASGSSS